MYLHGKYVNYTIFFINQFVNYQIKLVFIKKKKKKKTILENEPRIK